MKEIIVITASNEKQAQYCRQEVKFRKENGLLNKDQMVIIVPDPEGRRIGSGGGTMNALLKCVEILSLENGDNSLNVDVLHNCFIIIIHSGGDSQRCPNLSICGKAWSFFPCLNDNDYLSSNIDITINLIHKIFKTKEPGVVVCCGDVLLEINEDFDFICHKNAITGLSVSADCEVGVNHGVFHLDRNTYEVINYYQKPSKEILISNNVIESNQIFIDTGIIYIHTTIMKTLLSLFLVQPLSYSTYLNKSNEYISIELYSDILLSLNGQSPVANQHTTTDPLLQQSREILYSSLNKVKLFSNYVINGHFYHTGTTKEYLDLLRNKRCRNYFKFSNNLLTKQHSIISDISTTSTIINSIFDCKQIFIDDSSFVEHCTIVNNINIGKYCWVSNIRNIKTKMNIPDYFCLQEISMNLNNNSYIYIAYHFNDNIKGNYNDPKSTVFGLSWQTFMELMNLDESGIWDQSISQPHTFWNAKLFPLMNHLTNQCIGLFMLDISLVSRDVINEYKHSERYSLQAILLNASSLYESVYKWRLMENIRNL